MHKLLARKQNTLLFRTSLFSISQNMMSTSDKTTKSIKIDDLPKQFNNFVVSFDNYET